MVGIRGERVWISFLELIELADRGSVDMKEWEEVRMTAGFWRASTVSQE